MGGPATGTHCPSQDRKARRTMTTKKKKRKIEITGEGTKNCSRSVENISWFNAKAKPNYREKAQKETFRVTT